MMEKSIKKVVTAAVSLTLAASVAVMPASAVYYSSSFAFDATGESFAIPEAFRYYMTINRFDGGIGTMDSPSDICFDENGMLYVVDKDNARILIMDGDGKVNTIIGATMPDGAEEIVEEEAEEEESTEGTEEEGIEAQDESEETETPEEPEVPEESDPVIVDIIEDPVVKDAQVEKTDYTIEVTSLDDLATILSRAAAERFLKGEYTEGKAVENLTVRLAADLTVASAADAAKFDVAGYRYRYYYKDANNTAAGNLQETIDLNVKFEIAEGTTFTVSTAIDFGAIDVANKGTLVVTPTGRMDITNCKLDSAEGQLIQHYKGAIINAQSNDADGGEASVAEGTLATYVVDEEYSVRFMYMYLKAPEGICVDGNGRIYICDTENHRLITMDSDLGDIKYYTEEMVREEAMLLGSDYNFTPSKVGISNTGMMYVLNKSNYKGFFTMNKEGDFCGFVGATKVTASVTEVLVQIFGSVSQKNQLANKQPAPATNLYVVDNMIYSVVRPSSTEPDPKRVKKINIVGADLFPDGDYTISSYSTEEQERVTTNYVDICVDDYGIITALDDELGYIVQMNQLGDIVACFGGKSNRQGQFLLPTALDINPDNDRIYVSDSLKGSIQVFEPTKFIDLVHEASDMYFEGLYGDAVGLWEQVIAIDETYDLAHIGVAESLYGDGYNVDAMEKFQYAWNYEGYDKAFSDFRRSLFRYYFAPFALSILALVVLLAYGFVALKRKSDELYK